MGEELTAQDRISAAHPTILDFRAGQCRNDNRALSHTYAETEDGLFPMCGYGWNRSSGHAFSIFRNTYGSEGECKRCAKNLRAGKPPVLDGFQHKTKWL